MNEITLSGTYDDIYGGWTTGTGTDKADRNDSHNNKLIFMGGAAVNIYGGCTESDGGKAYGNTVFFIKTGAADPHAHVIYGGRTRGITSGEASRNTVTVNASYNESYGLGKDGIRREKAGRYENQGIRTIFGAQRVPQSVLEKSK